MVHRSATGAMPLSRRMGAVTTWCVPHVKQNFVGLASVPGNHMAPAGITATGSMKRTHSLQEMLRQ